MRRLLIKWILKVLYRVKVEGSVPDKLPERLVVISNHQSFLDAFVVGAFLPLKPTWVVHTDIWAKWYFRILISWQSCVVVDTARPQAIRTLVREIEKGKPVVIFPEGRLTVTGSLMKVYDGPAFLAAKTGAAILPVSISGTIYTAFTRLKPPFPRKTFPRVRLTVFPLEYIPMPEARTGRLRRQIASRQMRRLLERTRFQSRHRPTLFEAFLDAIELYGPDTVMLDDVRRREQTFGFLLKAALALGRLASKLAAEGETIGVLLPNTDATVALLFGMFGARRIPAMLNYAAGAEGLKTACTAAEIRTVITSREFLEKARLTDKVSRLTGVELIYLEDLRARFGLLDKLWLVGWALRRPRRVAKPARPDDAAIMLFTSGSEGMPKGVVLSHDSILANVEQIRAVIEFSNRDKFMTALPMFHSFGLTAGVLLPLVSGCRLFLYPSPLHFRMIPELTYDQDCTVLFGTPAFLGKYGLVANPYDFYKVRYVVAGAEKLSDEIRQLYHEKFGIRILEGYGATECSPVLSVNTPFACKSGTVGMLLPGIEHRLVPVEGIPEGGELHVRGPNLMLGYLRHTRPGVLEPPSSEVGEGWYDTGDVVEIDADGFVRITARLRRFVKVAGEMVSLEIAERIAKAASSKLPSAATSRERPGRGEEIVLFTQDPALNKQHLVAAARETGLPELAVARRVVHVDKLPLLGTGKCDYVKLKSMAGAL